MNYLLGLLSGLAFGCGGPVPEPACISRCGVGLYDAAMCEGFQEAEDRALTAFAKHVGGWDEEFTCSQIMGYELQIHEAEIVDGRRGWTDQYGRRVAGLTYCRERKIVIVRAPWSYTPLAHEYAHAIEECSGIDHDDWDTKGIYQATWEAQGL